MTPLLPILLDFDSRKGSFLDLSGKNVLTATNISFKQTEKGLAAKFNGTDSKIVCSSDFIKTNPVVINMWVKVNKKTLFRYLSNNKLIVYSNLSTAAQIDQTNDNTSAFPTLATDSFNKWLNICLIVPSSGNVSCYVNAIFKSSANCGPRINGVQNVTIGNDAISTTNALLGYIIKTQVYLGIPNNIQQFVNELYLDFINAKPINKPIVFQNNFNIFKPTEIREQGLIASYNFKPINGKLPNIAWDNPANGYNARQLDGIPIRASAPNVTNPITINNGVRFLSKGFAISGYSLSNSNYLKPKEISVIATVNLLDLSGYAIAGIFYNGNSLGNNGVFLGHGNYRSVFINTYTGPVFPTPLGTYRTLALTYKSGIGGKLFVNGIPIVTIPNSGDIIYDSGNVKIGYWQDTLTWGTNHIISNLKIYNRVLLDKEIIDYHNQFASKETLNEDFSQYSIGATKINNWYFTGTVSIAEETTKNNVVKIGSKLLNINSGEAYTQSNTAYGTWEWKVKYTSLPVGFYNGIQFIASEKKTSLTNLGYSITPSVTVTSGIIDSIIIDKGQPHGFGGSVIKTVPTNLILNTWYRFKVTRSNNNDFKLFINDKVVTTFNDSTYTTSKYFGFSKPYFNKYFTDIKISQGIII